MADELPRSILREPLGAARSVSNAFMCLYDPRFLRVGRKVTTNWYFSQEHVVVSYAEDARGIVEDAVGRSRRVRVSVPAFGYLADIVEGSALVATLPRHFARHVEGTRPHLEIAELPFTIESTRLELLWSRVTDSDAACRFVRQLLPAIVERVESEPATAAPKRQRRAPSSSR